MKTSLELISDIIHWLERFVKENPEKKMSLESFIIWLNTRLFEERHDTQSIHGDDTLDMELSFLLALQNRHYKVYAKRALGESELSSPDGFSFLYHLSLVDSYRKMELIKMHHIEPPSGIEVLKRLLKKELIKEFDDPDDKRAKRISITDTGRKEIQSILPKMQMVFKSMAAGMSLNEKVHVISFLRQMNEYHFKKTSIL